MSAMTAPASRADETLIIENRALNPADMIASAAISMSPEEARDAFGAGYAALTGSGRPDRLDLTRLLVDPYLTALPKLLARHGDDENLRRLGAEILTVLMALKEHQSSTISHLHVFAIKDDERPRSLKLPMVKLDLVVEADLYADLCTMARRGGPWLAFASTEVLEEIGGADPIALLNGLIEHDQYMAAVSFKIKLEGRQLEVLQAFFRTS